MFRRKGFTLIELVMIIVILGLLAAVAIPKYFDLTDKAKVSAEKGVVGGVRAGISTYYASACANGTCVYPGSLDNASNGGCNSTNVCFDTVLSQGGITADWTKSGSVYTGPKNNTYTYNGTTGEFK